MAEYHRILSYLYRYDKMLKMDCKGFVKVEQKHDGWKFTVQISDERLREDTALRLCVYTEEKGRWELIILDTLSPFRQKEENIVCYTAEQLPEGFDIRNLHGVLLFYSEIPLSPGHGTFPYYGSVWIGDEIPLEELLKEQAQPETVGETEKVKETKTEPVREEHTEPWEEKQEVAEEVVDETEPEWEAVEEERKDESVELNPEKEEVSVDGEQTESEEEREPEELSTTEEESPADMWTELQKTAPSVDNIFNGAFREGFQVQTEQLSLLCPQETMLAHNQFLLSGYAAYGHLLAGKVRYGGKVRRCIGVPGIYGNRERYMAQIYDFPVFLPRTENRIKTGGFGYWLRLID